MNPPRQRPWHHNPQQYALLEYASLRQACPGGVYLSLKPGSPLQWSGVLFVRKGPYAPAILRFQVSFPPDYPNLPPSITFLSDIFHPLVAPLTTYTYTTGSSSLDTVSATDEERLSPGGFSLRHGFPHWFGRAQKSATSSARSSRNVSGVQESARKHGEEAYMIPPPDGLSSRGSPRMSHTPFTSAAQATSFRATSILEVLQYVKHAFDDEASLDTLPLDAAGNSGAWKAWRAYRRSSGMEVDDTVMGQQDEWSWDGVWEERVKKGIDASIAESTLYGSTGGGDDLIRFVDLDEDLIKEIKQQMLGSAL